MLRHCQKEAQLEMAKKEPGVKLPPVDQIGIVVKDIDRAIEYYSSTFGWGPFRVREREMKGFTYRDKIGDCRLKLAFARAGEKAPPPLCHCEAIS